MPKNKFGHAFTTAEMYDRPLAFKWLQARVDFTLLGQNLTGVVVDVDDVHRTLTVMVVQNMGKYDALVRITSDIKSFTLNTSKDELTSPTMDIAPKLPPRKRKNNNSLTVRE